MLEKTINDNKQKLINSIKKAVSFKSVSIKNESKEAPFGAECQRVLEYVLSLGKEFGFRTKNIDGYCGYIEFGEGPEMLGIIGHLDVVPANKEDGWLFDPYKAEIRDNKIYGRGTMDDKGPVLSCLYAMKAVSENYKLNKRVRLIIGLNEEKDWECIERYKQTEELPTIGFSPDASFPCIYAEKGIVTLTLSHDFSLKETEIIEISCDNNAINVVPKEASITLKVADKSKYPERKDIKIQQLEENIIKIIAFGKSSHAAIPTHGENAITKLLMYLNEITPSKYLTTIQKFGFFDLENPQYLGGKKLPDESGVLTSNIGIVEYKNNKLILKSNLRVPIKTSFKEIETACQLLTKKILGLSYSLTGKNEKLYVEKDNYLVKTLTKIFEEETGIKAEPLAIGGGTYARAFENCISYGMTMPNEEDLCHQVNENIDIDNLMLATNIYAKAIVELTK